MTRPDDYPFDMSNLLPQQRGPLLEREVEALLGAPSRASSPAFADVAALLNELHAVVDGPAPTPSRQLAAILEHGLPDGAGASPPSPSTEPRRRLRLAALVVGVSSAVSLPLMGVAAAQDRLPDAAQHVVAKVIEATTPFTVADPKEDSSREPARNVAPPTSTSRHGVPVLPGVPATVGRVPPVVVDPDDGTTVGEDDVEPRGDVAGAETPADKPTDEPADKPADKPTDKPTDKPSEKAAEPASPGSSAPPSAAPPPATPPAQPTGSTPSPAEPSVAVLPPLSPAETRPNVGNSSNTTTRRPDTTRVPARPTDRGQPSDRAATHATR